MAVKADVALFDFGRVLADWDPRYLYSKLIAEPERLDRFLGEVCTLDWHAAHDRGVAMTDNAAPLIGRFPEFEAEIRAWEARWPEMFAGPIPGVPAIVRRLHAAGRPLYMLTNLPAEKKSHILETFDVAPLFRDIIVSGEEGVMKPDRRIYEIAAARICAAPERIVFIDDSPANVDAARAFGMDAVLFADAATLERDLDARGLFE